MSPKRKGSSTARQSAHKRARKASNVQTGPPRRSKRQAGSSPEVAARDDIDTIGRRDSVQSKRRKSKNTTNTKNDSGSDQTQRPHAAGSNTGAEQSVAETHAQRNVNATETEVTQPNSAVVKDNSVSPLESQAKASEDAAIIDTNQEVKHDNALDQTGTEKANANGAVQKEVQPRGLQTPPQGSTSPFQSYEGANSIPSQASEEETAIQEPSELSRVGALSAARGDTHSASDQDLQDPSTPSAGGETLLQRFLDASHENGEDEPSLSEVTGEANCGTSGTTEVVKLAETSQPIAFQQDYQAICTPHSSQSDENLIFEHHLSQPEIGQYTEDLAFSTSVPDLQNNVKAPKDAGVIITKSPSPSDISTPHDLEDDPDLFGDDLEPLPLADSPLLVVVDAPPPTPAQSPFAFGTSVIPPKPKPEDEELKDIMSFRPEDQFNEARRQIAGRAGKTIREYCDSLGKDKLAAEARQMVRDARAEEERAAQEFLDEQNAKQGRYVQTQVESHTYPEESVPQVATPPQQVIAEDLPSGDGQIEGEDHSAQDIGWGEPASRVADEVSRPAEETQDEGPEGAAEDAHVEVQLPELTAGEEKKPVTPPKKKPGTKNYAGGVKPMTHAKHSLLGSTPGLEKELFGEAYIARYDNKYESTPHENKAWDADYKAPEHLMSRAIPKGMPKILNASTVGNAGDKRWYETELSRERVPLKPKDDKKEEDDKEDKEGKNGEHVGNDDHDEDVTIDEDEMIDDDDEDDEDEATREAEDAGQKQDDEAVGALGIVPNAGDHHD